MKLNSIEMTYINLGQRMHTLHLWQQVLGNDAIEISFAEPIISRREYLMGSRRGSMLLTQEIEFRLLERVLVRLFLKVEQFGSI